MVVASATMVGALTVTGQTASANPAETWLALSDIHLDIIDDSPDPSNYSSDTNRALLDSALAQMKRAAPNPAVVLLPGDFIMHKLRERFSHIPSAADDAGLRTMRWIASRLARAFPHSQFVIALGNNDVPCGDYRTANDSAYAKALARIWAPLVDRDGNSPKFVSSFVHGGYYTVRLSSAKLQLIVLNTVAFSTEYRGDCGANHSSAQDQLAWLSATLRAAPAGMRNAVIMHIPPGVDAFSSEYLHGFVIWHFLRPRYDQTLVDILRSKVNRVVYAIAGHAHRFDVRFAGDVPVLILGSLSPVYGNNPAFYLLRVGTGGSLTDIETYSYEETARSWQAPRRFDATWHVDRLDAKSLQRLHAELGRSESARERWDRQGGGWPPWPVGTSGIWGTRWRIAWCAQDIIRKDVAACAGTQDRLPFLALTIAVLVAALAGIAILLKSRRSRAGRRTEKARRS